MRHRTPNYLLTVVVTLFFAVLLIGCGDDFAKHHQVGNVYEVVGNLYIFEDRLTDSPRIELQKRPETLPKGTKIRISSIEKRSQSSWNNGFSSYYVVRVNVLASGHRDRTYDASWLVEGVNFGDRMDTLKAVGE